jgi:ATP-dependent Lon protease
MRDEAEIKGHRRTYIGAMPGKFLQSLKTVGTANPVLMLDEIDKVGKDFRGDPASALLEVLDPEQNSDFLDHYLDVRFDLSRCMFITTANQLDTIPPALLDRMEIIKLSGYILEEKLEIARRYLIPRALEEHGLTTSDVELNEDGLIKIIERYAREAGVRGLENQIKKVMRRITRRHAQGQKDKVVVGHDNVEEFLRQPTFPEEHLFGRNVPGIVVGLAWTSMGGAVLQIEAAAVKSSAPSYRQTGQLGDVMKESAEIAYSHVRSKAVSFAIPEAFFAEHSVHLHVPAGATPKDGPSAGITMALALYSLATGRPVPRNLAMTGELTLTGSVLPVGGIKEKIIAARRAGIQRIILPGENLKDYKELPEFIRSGLKLYFVRSFSDVVKVTFGADQGAL